MESARRGWMDYKMELPELSGSEKQVTWADELRAEMINEYEEKIQNFNERYEKVKSLMAEKSDIVNRYTLEDVKISIINKEYKKIITSKEELSSAIDYALTKYTNARFWIDNRNGCLAVIVEDYRKYCRRAKDSIDIKKSIKKNGKKELTVVPAVQNKKSGVVTLEYKDGVIFACYIKDMDFIAIVKKLNYKWDGALWRRKITEYTGNAAERAAELGNKLLLAGYTVCFFDEISKDMAVSGTFEPENDRWVKCFDGELAITWHGRNNRLFNLAKKIPGAKWEDGSMVVSVEFYNEVEDFAGIMGFDISKKAQEKIEEYKKTEKEFVSKNIAVPQNENISDKERIAKTLKRTGTVIEDLMDD